MTGPQSRGSSDSGLPLPHALRDAALAVVTAALWMGDSDGSSVVRSTATGLMTALVAYLWHEWGHLGAARAAGSFVQLPRSAFEVFLFRFDTGRSSPRQFVAMSMGGFLASAVALAVIAAWAPLARLSGRVSLGLALAGVVATLVLELPPFLRVLRGGPMPGGAAFVREEPPA